MHCRKKLMYNGLFISDDIYNADICSEVLGDTTFGELEYGLTQYVTPRDRHLLIHPGKKYRLCKHYIYTLLNEWLFIDTLYNVYEVIRIVPTPPLPVDVKKHVVYQCVEVKYFYANNKLEYYDFLYS